MTTDTDLRGELEAWMDAPFDLPDEGPFERPQDERRANAMLRKLAAKRRELTQIAAMVDDEISRLKAFRDDRTAGIGRVCTDIERALEGYTRAVLDGRVKDKRLAYPNGTLALRAKPVRPVVTDEDDVKAWALADESRAKALTETVTKVKLQPLAHVAVAGPALDDVTDDDGTVWKRWTAVTADGEPIPGVEVRRPADDGFTATPN